MNFCGLAFELIWTPTTSVSTFRKRYFSFPNFVRPQNFEINDTTSLQLHKSTISVVSSLVQSPMSYEKTFPNSKPLNNKSKDNFLNLRIIESWVNCIKWQLIKLAQLARIKGKEVLNHLVWAVSLFPLVSVLQELALTALASQPVVPQTARKLVYLSISTRKKWFQVLFRNAY